MKIWFQRNNSTPLLVGNYILGVFDQKIRHEPYQTFKLVCESWHLQRADLIFHDCQRKMTYSHTNMHLCLLFPCFIICCIFGFMLLRAAHIIRIKQTGWSSRAHFWRRKWPFFPQVEHRRALVSEQEAELPLIKSGPMCLLNVLNKGLDNPGVLHSTNTRVYFWTN